MWYYVTDNADPLLVQAAARYDEAVIVQKELPRTAELVFLETKSFERKQVDAKCIAINRAEPIETAGWNYAVQEPFDRDMLIRMAKIMCGRNPLLQQSTLASACLHALHVQMHLLGYRYLQKAVTQISEAEHPMQLSMMHDIYPDVAVVYGSTPMMVNRAIRHAIDSAWKHGATDVQRSYFGYAASDKKGVPTNVEFIYAVVERIRLLKGEGITA